jgi:allantoinase
VADLVVRSTRVVTGGETRPAAVHVAGGRIVAVRGYEDAAGPSVTDVGDLVLMPGVIDAHVHANEPGRTEWEGFETATRAAAAGGVTTVVDMPLNAVPPATTVDGLRAKIAAAQGKIAVDVALWGGLVPENAGGLDALFDAGVHGVKCFLTPSGVDEFGHVGEAELRRAMPVIARRGGVLLAHAEAPDALVAAEAGADPRAYATYLRTRPVESETAAVAMLLRLCAETGCPVHVVHLSSGEGAALVRAAKRDGVPVTAETCPHYLRFSASDVGDGATEMKCAPPIREAAQREHLWDALADGTLDLVASDHSPAPAALKAHDTGDFLAAWGGIASLQLLLPAVWTEAAARGHTFRRLAEWLCEAPARLAGLAHRKGTIAEGMDADLVAWDPDARWMVDPHRLEHRHPLTPYAGAIVQGAVHATWVRGALAFDRGAFAERPAGRVVLPASPA